MCGRDRRTRGGLSPAEQFYAARAVMITGREGFAMNKWNNCVRKAGNIAAALFLAGIAAAVMLFPADTGRGISSGITLCLEKIVPSVFPAMVVCVMTVECGFAAKAGRLLAPLSRKLFGLPGEAAAAVMLSLIGGYPAGAKTVVELQDCGAITTGQAARMALFCFCSGPAFLTGVVGGLTGSAAAGWLLLGVQAVVVVVLGVLFCRIPASDMPDSGKQAAVALNPEKSRPLSESIVVSVSKSASAVMQVCVYVVVFSAVSAILERTGASAAVEEILVRTGFSERLAGSVVPSLLEVTGGCVRSAESGLPMIAFAVGFGGLSVHLQVLAITEKLGVNKPLFFAARMAQGLLSAALTAAVVEVLPQGVAVTASAELTGSRLSGSTQGAVMLVVMCAVCVVCLPLNVNRDGIATPERKLP